MFRCHALVGTSFYGHECTSHGRRSLTASLPMTKTRSARPLSLETTRWFLNPQEDGDPEADGLGELENSILGPPTNVAVTPDQSLALVANAVHSEKTESESHGHARRRIVRDRPESVASEAGANTQGWASTVGHCHQQGRQACSGRKSRQQVHYAPGDRWFQGLGR